jgi:DNA modification methylase
MRDVLDGLHSGRVCYTTSLGAQLSGDSLALLAELPAESVDLFATSPPFPLLRKKAYGNEDQAWLTDFAKSAKDALKPTGSLVIDIGGAYQFADCTSTVPCSICFPRWGARGSNPEPMG